ncbi:MAG: transporter substrate-binding domain-containing protein [Euryarchaeota archaeon]|nr:transporter substrate-binding domain-containing protein [Euryarchaeota archaeon]
MGILMAPLPPDVTTGAPFDANVTVTGVAKVVAADIGLHFSSNSTNDPTHAAYEMSCEEAGNDSNQTFSFTCTIDEPGTWYFRGYFQGPADKDPIWTNESTVRSHGWTAMGEVVVGTDAAFPPFEHIDSESGAFVGFDIDMITEIGNRSSFTPKLENIGFDPLIPALRGDKIRLAVSAISIPETLPDGVVFSTSYHDAKQAMVVRESDKDKYDSISDMTGKTLRVGVQAGSAGVSAAVANFTEEGTARYDSYALAIDALRRGKIDAVVIDAPLYQTEVGQDSGLTKIFDFSVGDLYGIAMKADDFAIQVRINMALKEMEADGTLTAFRIKWGI